MIPMWIASAVLVAAVAMGARGWAPMLAFGLGGFAGGTALYQLVLSVRRYGGWGLTGRRNGGMVVHLGVVFVAVAFAASQSYVRQAEFDLAAGQVAYFAGHEIVYMGSAVVEHDNRTERVAYVRVDNSKTYTPAVAMYPFASRTIGIPSVRSTLRDDVALSVLLFPEITESAANETNLSNDDASSSTLSSMSSQNVDRVILRVTVQPLVVWLWLGGIMMALGTLLSLIPNRSSAIKTINLYQSSSDLGDTKHDTLIEAAHEYDAGHDTSSDTTHAALYGTSSDTTHENYET